MGFPGFPDIEKMKADGDINGLINALDFRKRDSHHSFIRIKAADALWETDAKQGNPALLARAVKVLTGMLKEKESILVEAAARALGRSGDPRAVKPLSDLLKSKLAAQDWDLRIAVVVALGGIKDAGVVEPLSKALKDQHDWVRVAGVKSLGNSGSSRAVAPLINILKDADSNMRQQAAISLGKIGNPQGVNALVLALKDTDKFVRQAAAEALGMIGDTRAAEPLSAAIKDPEEGVRKAAAEALGRIGDTRTVDPLMAALKDADRVVREQAVKALGDMGWRPAAEEQKAWYAIARQDWEQCAALGEPAIQPLVTAIMEWTGSARRNAALALEHMGWKPVSGQHKACFFIARRNWRDCEALGEPAIEPLSAALLHETCEEMEDRDVRAAAAMTLGRIGRRMEDAAQRSRVVDVLLEALKDVTMTGRESVVTALGMMEDVRAVEPLIAALEKEKNLFVRLHAAQQLGRFQDTRAIAALRTALQDENPSVREAAAASLNNLEKVMAAQAERFDLRSDQERRIERAATAGESLGAEIDRLIAELIQIGRTDGFRSTRPGGMFDQSCDHIRAHEIGEELNREGGMALMKAVYYRVRAALPGEARALEGCWSYIGEWRA